jgi:Fe-Mn family superoxide dismutase
MNKREFIKTSSVLSVGAMVAPMAACQSKDAAKAAAPEGFVLPDLPYATDALSQYIDQQTMEIHHGKHHAGYVRKLNAALEGHAMKGKDLAEIVAKVTADDAGVRNNGGGHYNHSLFWKVMTPGGGQNPSGVLGDAINSTFGSYEAFQEAFGNAAATRFGSGWAWLSVDANGKLFVSSTPNQDNPMMAQIVEQSGTPILGIDVWEHAYYLKYQNRRKEYIGNFMKIINWEQVAANLAAIG